MELNVKDFGQVFTPNDIVKNMLSLRNNNGTILEPSGGDGAFSNEIENCVSIELDSKFSDLHTHNMDFFDYPIDNKFDTVIGNPPYVRYSDILDETKEKLNFNIFDKRTNLYCFFIEKSFNHLTDNGEIIFITPREFIKSTACIKMNEMLYEHGTITHFYEYGDEVVFKGFSPNVVVWRYVKNDFTRKTLTNNGEKDYTVIGGQAHFIDGSYTERFNELFYVKVGGVSGKDDIFTHDDGNIETVCSSTVYSGNLKKVFFDIKNEYILSKKEELINRKIKKFNESNWWKWGRNFYISEKDRIYVNGKTRADNPFFTNECKYYDGSVLGIFPVNNDIDINKTIVELNKLDWCEMGFKVGGRYVFSQKALNNTVLPSGFYDRVKK